MASVTAGQRARPATDRGERIYAIGDVHGCYELLVALLARLDEHDAGLPAARSQHMLLLGDLIDRGPDSAKVLGFLYDLTRETDQVLVLQGNHEQLMLRALDGEPGMLKAWMRVGGKQTLQSFGITPPDPDEDVDIAGYTAMLNRSFPRPWIDWLRALPLRARSGDYFFCHAGVRPGVALNRQTATDLLWIRGEFLSDLGDHGAVIVHGHSVHTEPEVRHNRIGIDTGAYRTGILSAVYLEGTQRGIITTDSLIRAA
ncbi:MULTISPECIES: metallophosphoesterase family protein [unclassified Novosphingobium]|uniref:metallophosphoesterase family protein n=1 Tax=unclassified Novosphingobium TaxID=2644732 RepID=UPI00086923EB|nr:MULTISPECIES: metallophosphoesterase family protein [unclassified Novosphingobium]ODU68673.1 MAG: metallophosphoesterase [Novosphingobium sp. SCN 66-18]QCI93128.1 serine/threonine protein phosphatase [Novosphingobium sp. EMRT-2]RQW43900.1 serine/threonine protein phosphatase [Novosphingobium sp. LASN5T]